MKWSWSETMQNMHLFFESNPMILFSVATVLFFVVLLYHNRSKCVVNWPIVGMLPMIIANHNNLHDHFTSLLRQLDCTLVFKGPWFAGIDSVITCHLENANHMFNVHFSNYPKGARFSEMFDILGDGIFNVDGDLWSSQRRMAHSHFRQPSFKSSVVECTRNKVAKVLLPLLDHMVEFDKVVDLSNIFMRFTFDTTCTLVLGVDPGCLAPEFPSIPFAKALDEAEEGIFVRHIVPVFWWKLLRLLRVGQEKKIVEARKVVDHFIAQCFQERREGHKMSQGGSSNIKQGPINLMGQYMDHFRNDVDEHSNSSQSNEDKFLRDTVLTFLAAGKDTVGVTLVWFCWLVANNPNIEKKILEELREVHTMSVSKKHSKLEDEMIVFDAEEVDTLVYLHACVCETLRLYPPVPLNHKEVLKEDVLPSGHVLQPSTRVIFSSYSLGRMEDVWGADCLEFKPERWITEKGEFKQEPSYKFIAFHSGPRSCLGKSMSFTQIKLVVAALFYNYKVEVVEGQTVEPKISVVLHVKNGLIVKLKKRRIGGY